MPSFLKLFALFAAFVASSCASISPSQPPPGPALYKVGDDDTTIYIFGTIKVISPNTPSISPLVASALRESDMLVTGLQVNANSDPREVLARARLARGAVTDVLNGVQLGSYERALESIGRPADAFAEFEPWFVAMMLQSIVGRSEGFDSGSIINFRLQDNIEAGKVFGSILSCAQELDALDSLPMEDQAAHLSRVVQDLNGLGDRYREMERLWRIGNLLEASKLSNAIMVGKVRENVIAKRSRSFAGWIAGRLAEPGVVFVSVDVGHLGARDSIFEELAAREIRYERVYAIPPRKEHLKPRLKWNSSLTASCS